MTAARPRNSPRARQRLLDVLGIVRHVRRGRRAPEPPPVGRMRANAAVVLVDRPGAADHPLLRAILAAVRVDPAAVRVAGAPMADDTRVLLAIGVAAPASAAMAPPLDMLARDPAAKRALWRSLRRTLREA